MPAGSMSGKNHGTLSKGLIGPKSAGSHDAFALKECPASRAGRAATNVIGAAGRKSCISSPVTKKSSQNRLI